MPNNSDASCSDLFERAKAILVGGVDSPVRAFRAVGGNPLIVDHAQGSRLFDVDGREYLDYVCSWGALILGHAHPQVVAAIADQAQRGTSYGMTSPLEIELAEQIANALPSAWRSVRFVSSGTEATMSALRVARAFTKRDLLLKFGRAAITATPTASSWRAVRVLRRSKFLRVPACLPRSQSLPSTLLTTIFPPLSEFFGSIRGRISAVIVEPVAANMGVVPPPGSGLFLAGLRAITQREEAS